MSWVEAISRHERKLKDVATWKGDRWSPKDDAPSDVSSAYLAAIRQSRMIRAFREDTSSSWEDVPVPTVPWMLGSQLSVLFANPPADSGAVERILYEIYGLSTEDILLLARRG